LKIPFIPFLSLRYLKPKRSFVSVITIISVYLVSQGVWSMTVVLSVMNGLGDKMRESVSNFEPHLEIAHPDATMSDWRALRDIVVRQPGVIDARPYTQGQAILDFRQRVKTVKVFGLPPDPGPMRDKLEARTREGMGEFDTADGHAVVSSLLAEGMMIEVGSKISLLTLANGRELLDAQNESRKPKDLIPPYEFTVTGFYKEGAQTDPTVIYVSLKTGQEFYGLKGDEADGLAVDIAQPYEADATRLALLPALAGKELEITTWTGRNKSLFDALATERLMMALLLSMVVVVAAFAIMNTTITVTTQKRQEIGLMRAVGAAKRQVVAVFMLQGLAAGMLGAVVGLITAFVTLAQRKEILSSVAMTFNLDEATREFLSDLPVHIRGMDIAAIAVGSFIACALSALPPAFMAARLDAASALRNLAH